MTVAYAPAAASRGSARWLLLVSLALNLFFVGVVVAIAIRAPSTPARERDFFVRIDRLAATLPPADADLLRGGIKTSRAVIEDAQTKYRTAQDGIRDTLRQDPFDPAAMQAAMAKSRAARQNFDQVVQGVFASTAAQMSSAGRHAVADWPPGRKTTSNER